MSDVHSVFWKGKLTGVIGTLMFRNISRLKQILGGLRESADNSHPGRLRCRCRIGANYTLMTLSPKSGHSKAAGALPQGGQPTGGSILILGETGTGKEILASAFHTGKPGPRLLHPLRQNQLHGHPQQLLESLFGHEKGAFTGAVVLPGKEVRACLRRLHPTGRDAATWTCACKASSVACWRKGGMSTLEAEGSSARRPGDRLHES